MHFIVFNKTNSLRPIWRILLFLATTFLINIPLQLLLQEVLPKSLLRGALSATLYFFCVWFSLYIQIKKIDTVTFHQYGLKINSVWFIECCYGMLISLVQLSVLFILLYASGQIEIADFFTTFHPDLSYSFIQGFIAESYGLIIGTSVEELFFRSFLLYMCLLALKRVSLPVSQKAWLVVICIAPLFGIAHIGNEGYSIMAVINLSLDAILMSIPFLITGRLAMSVGLHFSWNLIQGAVYGFPISGHIAKASIIKLSILENSFTGGRFGPEASVLYLLVFAIALGFILLWKHKRNYTTYVHPIFNAFVSKK